MMYRNLSLESPVLPLCPHRLWRWGAVVMEEGSVQDFSTPVQVMPAQYLYFTPSGCGVPDGPWEALSLCGPGGAFQCPCSAYNMIKLPVMKPIWYLYLAIPSSLYFGNHLSETINNSTLHLFSLERQSMGEPRRDTFPPLHLPLFFQASYNSA